MIRFRNTDNGVVVEVPDWKVPKYDHSCNMERIDAPKPVSVKKAPKPAHKPQVKKA